MCESGTLSPHLPEGRRDPDRQQQYRSHDPRIHDRPQELDDDRYHLGARASAVIYSLVETARANGLHIYYYFDYLLTELPKLKEFTSEEEEATAMERLLPWSPDLPERCLKKGH